MKATILFLTIALSLPLLISAEENAIRDPFWPIGYTPPPPPGEEPVEKPKPVVKPIEKPKPAPPPKPITEDEWKLARKLLKITGYALADRSEENGEQKTSIVVINRKHYQSGDVVKLTSQGVEYTWRVGEIKNNFVDLKQESATRLTQSKPTVNKRTIPLAPPAGVIQ